MNQAEKEFRKKLISVLLENASTSETQLNHCVYKIATALKQQYKNTSNLDVWAFNSKVKAQVDELLNSYAKSLLNLTERQIKEVWNLVEIKNDLIIRGHIAPIAGAEIKVSWLYKWFNRILPGTFNPKTKIIISEYSLDEVMKAPRNTEALNAFLKRKSVDGLTFSNRIWNLKDSTIQPLIESYVARGIENGKSAAEISRDIRQYLNNPDALFRRVRDTNGKLKLSTAAKKYKPGRGVYRSAYKNARRLAVEEINQSYRAADHERWNKIDFVTGIEVELSEQHPIPDICDYFAGAYPKDFHFPGWHVQCLCHATPILMPRGKFKKYMAGESVEVQEIEGTPENFNQYLKENEKRISGWKSQPYWMSFNEKYINQT